MSEISACVTLKDPNKTVCPGEPLANPTGDADQSINITTSITTPVGFVSGYGTALPTTFSTSVMKTTSSSANPAAASDVPANTTMPAPPSNEHGHGPFHRAGPAIIALPMTFGTIFILIVLFYLWHKYRRDSFHKFFESLPGCGCLTRLRKTREKNKQVKRMRKLRILTGGNAGNEKSGQVAESRFHYHMKKFEDDAERARMKRSMDTPSRTPGSPYTPTRKGKTGTGITALPRMGSPWKSPKKASASDGVLLTSSPSPARSIGARNHGLYQCPQDNADNSSMLSWEETWHALGKPKESPSTPSSGTPLKKEGGHGMQEKVESEEESGPGQSWRKLV